MHDARVSSWLVRKVALRGSGPGVSVLLGVGVAAIVLLGLATVSAFVVVSRQDDRAGRIAVIPDPAQASGDAGDLRIVIPAIPNARRFDGRRITREFYARGHSSLVAPGLRTMPGPGEYYASTDLIELIRTNRVVAALFESQHLIGPIAARGLVQPHELRAVVGVGDDHRLLVEVDRFGGTPSPGVSMTESQPVLDRSVAAFALALVWLPATFFVLMIARLAHARRARRSEALHLIGYPSGRIRFLHFVEALCVCLPAAGVAAIVHWALARSITTLPGTSFGFFASDAQLPLPAYAGIGGFVVLGVCLAVCLEVSRDRHGIRGRLAPHRPGSRSALMLGSGALVGGFVLLVVPAAAPLPRGVVAGSIWGGLVLCSVGIAVAGSALVRRVLALGLRRAGPGALVGRRLATDRPTTALRLGGVLSVVIVLLLGTQCFVSILNGGSSGSWSERVTSRDVVLVVATDLTGAVPLRAIARRTPHGGASEQRTVRAGRASVPVVFSTCRRLYVLVGRTGAPTCARVDGPRWLGTPTRRYGSSFTIAGRVVTLPPPTATLDVAGLPRTFGGALLLSPDVAPGVPQASGATFFAVVPARELERTLAALSSLEPTMQFDLGPLDVHNPNTQQYRGQVEWLGLAIVVGLLVGFLSVLVASLGEAQERSPRMRAVRVLGASRRQLLVVHAWCVSVPLVLVGLAAVVTGLMVTWAMHHFDNRAEVDARLFGALVLGVIAGGAVVAATSWRSATRPSRRSGSFSA